MTLSMDATKLPAIMDPTKHDTKTTQTSYTFINLTFPHLFVISHSHPSHEMSFNPYVIHLLLKTQNTEEFIE